MEQPLSPQELEDQLRAIGAAKYHDKHPFHKLMNDGNLTKEQLQVWVVNRLYYQINIPVKDSLILAKCPDREVRREWIHRIIDHDGTADDPGGIEKWIRLGQAMGLTRPEVTDARLLPGVRYSVDAYVEFVRTKPWLQACASSLTELFAPKLMAKRLAAFEKHYTWIDPEALAYFRARLTQAPRDSDYGLALILERYKTREQQQLALDALDFKCDLLWAQLDAIYYHCVNPTRG
jgi:pyrroloquinoline-quinone synthase